MTQIEQGGWGRQTLSADVNHATRRLVKAGFPNMVTRFFFHDDTSDVRAEVAIGSTASHDTDEVVVALGEEARANFAVGGEPDAAAVAAEGLADGGDDADLTETVVEGEALGGFAGVVGGSSTRGRTRLRRSTISSMVTTVSSFQVRPSSRGIHSMKRTMTPSERENSANCSIWLSLKPRRRTQLTLTGPRPAAWAARTPARTFDEAARDAGDGGEGGLVDGVHADGDAGEARAL